MADRCDGSREKPGDFRPARQLHVEIGLDLRLVGEVDAAELYSVVDSNREYLREWLPWLDATNRIEDETAFISNCLEEYKKREGVFYTIILNGNIIGTISLNWIDWGNKGAGVGYWLSENQTGNGYVTKSCIRLMEHCFDDLNLHRFVLEAAIDNIPSCEIAERIGMRLEGVIKDREWLYDHYVDAKLYAITKPEWDKKRAS
tara:strand:- start:1108 stop:1713 length:606 start_codon:yes stop_codon:yes gene_type:complete